jgi:SAM-dependent methyltransferase
MTLPPGAGRDAASPDMRMYGELAEWWPLLSPPSHYVEEADDLLARLRIPRGADVPSLLELGAGGGSLASHLKRAFRLTLTDVSPGMLANSRVVNPEAEHVAGDMRTIRLHRQFDVVLIHDAIMYLTTPDDVRAALRTAAVHCREGGCVAVLPDCVRETFTPQTEHGGEDAPDGRGLRYLSWSWDPDPADDTFVVDYAFLLREADGSVRCAHDRHVEGVFARERWLGWFTEAGLDAHSEMDPYGRDVFIATRR